MAAALRLTEVTKEYLHEGKRLRALDSVSLEVGSGEFVAVVGRSGSGKSTLLNLMGLMDEPSSGLVEHRGSDLSASSERERERERLNGIGFVFQHFYLIPTLRAWENVALPLKAAGVGSAEREARLRELFGRVGLDHRRDHFPHELSGGEQQLVSIARALSNRPYVVLADEPIGELDPESGRRVVELLQDVNRAGTAVVMVTHNVEAIPRGTRRITLAEGRILSEAAP